MVTCMLAVSGFGVSVIQLRSIKKKILAGWCESQSTQGQSVCRCGLRPELAER